MKPPCHPLFCVIVAKMQPGPHEDPVLASCLASIDLAEVHVGNDIVTCRLGREPDGDRGPTPCFWCGGWGRKRLSEKCSVQEELVILGPPRNTKHSG